MGKSIRCKSERKNRSILRNGEFGQEEDARLGRILQGGVAKHKLSIFAPLVAPAPQSPVSDMQVDTLFENELVVIEEEMADANVAVEPKGEKLSKREYDAIHLSRNQYKIKYGKYGKGKSKK